MTVAMVPLAVVQWLDGRWDLWWRPVARFGYHMWTEVYICGRWRYIDAALAQTECDPTHIALAMLDLSQGSVNEASLSFLPILGALTIEIESAE